MAAPARTQSRQSSQQVQPGEYFAFPGVTRWTEQPDNNDNTVSTPQQAAQVPLTGQLYFKQVDIVFGWKYQATIAQTLAAGTQTLTASEYFPYNAIQAFAVNITNLYNLIDLQSFVDLMIFNFYRPQHQGAQGNTGLYTAPIKFPYNPQANNLTASNYTTASTSMVVQGYVPACIWFDEYFELDANANVQQVVHRVPVSPLYMSGTAREVTPSMNFAAWFGTNTDVNPVGVTGTNTTPATATGLSVTHRWMRKGIYGTSNPPEMPPVWKWRYALVSRRYGLAGVSQVDIPSKAVINNGGGGQILSVWFRFFDPASNPVNATNIGAPISVDNITIGKLLYGSGLIRFQDIPQQMKRRVMEQHDILLLDGVWLWDMAIDDNQRLTNGLALNAYTTDLTYHFEFTAALSSQAYVVVGHEYLTYVIDQAVSR